MIFFLFDPHILLFVILSSSCFEYHLYMYLQISRLLWQTHVLMCLCLCHMTLPVVQITLVLIKMVATASLLPTVRSFILLLEFLHIKGCLIKACILFAFKPFHCFCTEFEIFINTRYLFTHPSAILKYTILKYKLALLSFILIRQNV